ncbi:hypothetical protein RSK20926_05092 [Roseobacter sp. SK209-2-6]|uniref:translocation/assembly module TamB domain-containing protein n=1 Tax=Roseobacter sp. SK209-2-6 TaxID=388739 RepID=UPI0000F3CD31|nr:translocation/assembly module TamB domain-containing protein [Roseobacter sp. SK209-2-6]EBA15960.1 hypothetical protein RSK20926_05092 [Roseobacter sp. SK209-2-6]
MRYFSIKPILATTVFCLFSLGAPSAQTTQEEPSNEGSYLSELLEENLSGENQFIKVTGLTGALSSQASIEKLTVADASGVWLTLEGAELDWNRLALLRGEFSVNRLAAQRITVARAPEPLPPDETLPSPEATAFQLPELPVAVNIGEISAKRIQLGKALLGIEAELSLVGNLALADGNLTSLFDLRRVDRPGDHLFLEGAYSTQSSQLALDLQLQEAPGGLLSAALSLPAAPSLDLNLKGNGPLADFTADMRLASNGTERLAGQVQLLGLAATPTDEVGTQPKATDTGLQFSAELSGDIDPLLHPDYRPFFGADLQLHLTGKQHPETGLSLDQLQIQSQALELTGRLLISPDGLLQQADLFSQISPPMGQSAVLLPLPGAATTLGSSRVGLKLTSRQSWAIEGLIQDLSHPEGGLSELRLTGKGRLAKDSRSPLALNGEISAGLAGITLREKNLSRAIGNRLTLDTRISTDGQGRLALSGLRATAGDLATTGSLFFAGLDQGLEINSDLHVSVPSLKRFAPLTGLSLRGTFDGQVAGAFTPLSGEFDLKLAAQAKDLGLGISQLDTLTRGPLSLVFQGRRDAGGLTVENLSLKGEELTAHAHGDLSSHTGKMQFDASIHELQKILPQISGPLHLSSQVQRQGSDLNGKAELQGPNESHALLIGSATLQGNADLTFDAALSSLERFLPELPGKLTAKGRANRKDGVWQVEADTQAPAGALAKVAGSFNEDTGLADLTAKGTLRLEGANPFMKPNLLQGSAAFDLALQGAHSLAALNGTISTANARLVLPTAGQNLNGINAQVTLAQSSANVRVSAQPQEGGSLQISGPVSLSAPFQTALNIGLSGVVLKDHLSYETLLNGDLNLTGALTGQAGLSGRIDVGETVINLNTAGGSISSAPIPPIRHFGESRESRLTRSRAGLTQTAGSAGSNSNIALDILINAPDRIYARGRGLRSELGGQIHLRGSTADLAPSGQIELIRGTFDILGRRLTLDEGRITLLGDLMPYLELKSSASTANGTATLEISGRSDAPEIKVISDPPRPSEEALALLLFGDNIGNLSPLALARLASSALELSGRGGNRAANKLQQETGADNVDIGLDNLGAGLLGLGGYVSDNVYTDFNVNTRGDSELSINLDLSKSLTATGTVDSAGETGVGLFFKRDY